MNEKTQHVDSAARVDVDKLEQNIERYMRAIMMSLRIAVSSIERIADALEGMQRAQTEALRQALMEEFGTGGTRKAAPEVEPARSTDG